MSTINYPRVLLGGVIAGVVLAIGETILNSVVLAADWASLGLNIDAATMPTWRSAALFGVLICFGVVLVWVYAAIRPRFGPGPGTAIIAGVVLWMIAWALLGASASLSGMITARIAAISAVWGVSNFLPRLLRGHGSTANRERPAALRTRTVN